MIRNKAFLFLMILMLFPDIFGTGNVFSSDRLLEVRIDNLDRAGLIRLYQTDVNIHSIKGNTAKAHISAGYLETLRNLGYRVTVISDRIGRDLRGYPDYSELTAELSAIESEYPDICRLSSIGRTDQERELWVMKISDNADTEEDEPEVKYIAAIHGDETVGMALCLNLIHLLSEGYGSDPRLTFLINEIEIWIMPLMNPDGFMLRSRFNAEGKDLNRSFPDRFKDPVNTTDGRPAETRHVMNWSSEHSFVLSASFHAGAQVVNYPYDADTDIWASYSETPDDALFTEQSLTYASLNLPMYNSSEFEQGITNGVKWYFIYGGMQDWNYVWMGCNEVTIELSEDKWPSYSEIPELWEDNRESMLAYMEWCLRGVRGIVTDSLTGSPLNATISVIGTDHDIFTDPDVGDFHRMLLPGVYNIRISADGYETQIIPGVSVGDGDAVRLNAALFPNNDMGSHIRGIITNSLTGSPLAATLSVSSTDDAFADPDSSDYNQTLVSGDDVFADPDTGDYHQTLLPGVYNIRISADGYATQIIPGVSVEDGEAVQLNASLLPGDIDNDGHVCLRDAVLALQVLTGMEGTADMNGNGRIGLEDVICVLRVLSFEF